LDKYPKKSKSGRFPNLGIGPRWFELRFHHEQCRLWRNRARFKVVTAGRRSGKTELAKRMLIKQLFMNKLHGLPGRFFAAAPTRDQAKRIFWRDLKALLPRVWTAYTSESELLLRTTDGAELHVIGLDKPMRLEGVPWDGCVIDELADCKPGIWDANIRPALADRQGWAWLIGVPDLHGPSQIEYQRFYQLGVSRANPEWRSFSWPSADILPAAEIESARGRMDARLFEQEFLGKFIVAGGRAFPDFDFATHVHPAFYRKDRPLCWSLDFNINPMCSGILQHHDGMIYVIDELVLPDTRTDHAVDAFFQLAAARGWNLKGLTIYGDATGSARDSTSGISDWHIVANRLKAYTPILKVPRANPPIKDTLNAVNAKLRDANGHVHVCIDPRCVRLIEDLNTALWPGDLEPHHALSWFRYFVEREYPIMYEMPATTGGVVAVTA